MEGSSLAGPTAVLAQSNLVDCAVLAHPPLGLPGGFTPGSPVSTQKFLDFIQKNFFNKYLNF
jgi:hypothetical protein